MPDAPAYLSQPWIDAARRRVERIDSLHELVGRVSLALLMVVTDRPGLAGEAVYIRFEEGRLADVASGARDSVETKHPHADFTIWADYETFVDLHAGRITERIAVLSGRVRLKGSMFRALRLLKTVERLNSILRQEPARY